MERYVLYTINSKMSVLEICMPSKMLILLFRAFFSSSLLGVCFIRALIPVITLYEFDSVAADFFYLNWQGV